MRKRKHGLGHERSEMCVWETSGSASGRENLESLEIPTVSGGYYRLKHPCTREKKAGRQQTTSTESLD